MDEKLGAKALQKMEIIKIKTYYKKNKILTISRHKNKNKNNRGLLP
jgi:hypothetical protein